MMLAICGRTSTLLSAVTVPVASSITSTSRFCTDTVVTLTGGPLAPAVAGAAEELAAALAETGRQVTQAASVVKEADTKTGRSVAEIDSLAGMSERIGVVIGLIQAIAEDAEAGGGSLSGGVQRLAKRGLAKVFDIGARFWIDVDDDVAFEQATQEQSRLSAAVP